MTASVRTQLRKLLCNRPTACRRNEESATRPWIAVPVSETLTRASRVRTSKAAHFAVQNGTAGLVLFAFDLIQPLPVVCWALTLGAPLYQAFTAYHYRQLASKPETSWDAKDRQRFQSAILDGWCLGHQDKSELPCHLGGTKCSSDC